MSEELKEEKVSTRKPRAKKSDTTEGAKTTRKKKDDGKGTEESKTSTKKATSKSKSTAKSTKVKDADQVKEKDKAKEKPRTRSKVSSTKSKLVEESTINENVVDNSSPYPTTDELENIDPSKVKPTSNGGVFSGFIFEKKEGKPVRQIIVERIVQAMIEGRMLPWHKPFLSECINHITGIPYSGINRWLLMGSKSNEFITKKQLDKYNAKHKTSLVIPSTAEKYIVIYYTTKDSPISEEQADKLNEKGKGHVLVRKGVQWYKRTFVLRYYTVYDIADIPPDENGNKLEPQLGKNIHIVHTQAEKIINGYMQNEGVQLKNATSAYYIPSYDTVFSPPPEHYISSEAYYRTLFHEFAHSTGHEKRLNRESLKRYRFEKNRSREELIAEMCALFLASEAGFSQEGFEMDNSETYIVGWAEWMLENPKELLLGVAQADKAFKYIMEKSGAMPEGVTSTENDGLNLENVEMDMVVLE